MANFTIGQMVKVIKHGYVEATARIINITPKRGRITIEGYPLLVLDATGWQVGGKSHYRTTIEPLADGETPESIKAEKQAKLDAAEQARQAKEREQATKVTAWWTETGKAVWDARVTLPQAFMGEEVSIIRFTRYGEQHMPMITVTYRAAFGGAMRCEIYAAGLRGQEYTVEGDKTRKSISSYCSSTATGDNLPEALYNLCSC